MRRRISLLSLLLCAALFGSPAQAEAEESPPPSGTEGEDSSFTEAQVHHRRGVALSDAQDWEGALEQFDMAMRLYPTSRTLFNRAICLERLRRYAESMTALRQLLSSYGDELDEARQSAVEGEIQRLTGLVVRVSVRVRRPETAEVLLDGAPMGNTPLDDPLIMDPGRHVIEVRAEGFENQQYEIAPESEREVEVLVTLNPTGSVGTLVFVIAVPGAAISLDGAEVGETPMADPLIATTGPHTIEVSRAGYQSASVEVELAEGGTERVELTLLPLANLSAEESGTVEVDVNEEEATVTVNGRPWTPEPLPIGPHVVEVHREGFEPWRQVVSVESGETTPVDAVLQPNVEYLERYESRARSFRVASWVLGGLSIAILGGGLGLGIWNGGRRNDWEEEDALLCSERLHEDEHAERREANNELAASVNTIDAIAWVLLSAGVAALGTAFGLYFGGPDPDRYRPVTVTASLGGVSATVRW